MFVEGSEIDAFAPGSLIVDVSCDAGMGFDFARPTTFEEPVFEVGDLCTTTPWTTARRTCGSPRPGTSSARRSSRSSARWMSGPATWDLDPTLSKALEIRDGVIQNPKILSFQNRGGRAPIRGRHLGRRRIEREVSRHPPSEARLSATM